LFIYLFITNTVHVARGTICYVNYVKKYYYSLIIVYGYS